MSALKLTGLIGSHPLGALAAFGLLRILSEKEPRARLSFVEHDDWLAVIDAGCDDRNALIRFLSEWIATRVPPVFKAFGEDDVRIEPKTFRQKLERSLAGDDSESANGDLAAFLVALAADGAKDNSKGYVKPSPFYMASGQQSFLDTMKRIHGYVRKGDVWTEALFGPWRYATPEWGAGWDPGTERMHALRFKAPTKDKTACVAGAVWLAFEALPIFPTFSRAGEVHTVGWTEHERLDHFRWLLPATQSASTR
jgi:hypothetical protein